MPKSPDAFRTISEVADWLGVQAHVLRFWESKFAQVKPIKRAGGRRYYRPADMLLLGGIKKLLHDDGLTIKGTQKLLRENGVAFVADQSQALDDLTMAVIEGSPQISPEEPPEPVTAVDTAESASAPDDNAVATDDVENEAPAEPVLEQQAEPEPMAASQTPTDAPAEPLPATEPAAVEEAAAPELQNIAVDEPPQPAADAEETKQDMAPDAAPAAPDAPAKEETPAGDSVDAMPSFRARPRQIDPAPSPEDVPLASPSEPEITAPDEALPTPEAVESPDPSPDEVTAEAAEAIPAEAEPLAPKPRVVDVPIVPPASEISVDPSALTALGGLRQVSAEHAREIKPLLARLTRLRASMNSPRKEHPKD